MSSNVTKIDKKKVACAKVHVDMGKPHIDWFKEKPVVLHDESKVVVLPKVYDVYSIDAQQVSTFFNKVKNNTKANPLQTVVPLPFGCMLFDVQPNKEVPAQVRERYPNTIVVKGAKDGYELQMAYDGEKLSGQVKSGTLVYNIMPVESKGKYYCIIYEKTQPLEANKKQMYNGPQELKSNKVRYDR